MVNKVAQFSDIEDQTDFTANLYPLNGGAVINPSPVACPESLTTPGLYQPVFTTVLASIVTTYRIQILKDGVQWADGLIDMVETAGNYNAVSGPTVAQIGAGSQTGANTVTVTVTDGTDPVQNAIVTAWSGNEQVDSKTSNASGVAVLAMNNGTYDINAAKPGYSSATGSVVVSGVTAVPRVLTLWRVTPSEPPLVTGWLLCLDESGNPRAGVVHILRQVGTEQGGVGLSFSGQVRSNQSDADGLVQFTGMVPGQPYFIKRGSQGTEVAVTAEEDTFEFPQLLG